jgi:hypothetical protein
MDVVKIRVIAQSLPYGQVQGSFRPDTSPMTIEKSGLGSTVVILGFLGLYLDLYIQGST